MKSRIANNALWIILCRVVQAILQLLVGMFTARYLGPSNYGLINYAASLTAFFTPIMRLGLNGILVQEIISNPQREGETMGTAVGMNVLSGFLCIAGLVSFTAVANPGETETLIVCALYSISMLMEAIDILQYWFQAKLLSKFTSLAMLIAYAAASAYQITLLITGKNVYWFALSKTLDFAIIGVFLLILYRRCGGKKLVFSWTAAKHMLDRGKYYILSNMMVVIFAQTDRIMLKIMLDETATGLYSAAVACTGMTSFVFSAIIDSMRPSILSRKKDSEKLFKEEMTLLFSIIIFLSLAQCILITLLSPLIISILYGPAYEPAVNALRIVIWYTTFSYLGSVRNIWILAEEKQHFLWKINVVGAFTNVILNLLFIPMIGIVGAALASLLTQLITNVTISFVYKDLRPTARLMIRSLNIRQALAAFNRLFIRQQEET